MQHSQRTSPTLTIADPVAPRTLETTKPNEARATPVARYRAVSDDSFRVFELLERAAIVLFTILLLSSSVRHLPMLTEFATYFWMMGERVWGLLTALLGS